MAAQDSSTIPTLATLDLDDDEGEGEPQAQDETASEDGSDDELELPTFKLPAEPPQLDSLSLPSPIFGRSFVDLLAPLPSTPTTPSSIGSTSHLPHRPPSRLRSGSALSRTSIYDRVREPTLQFSNPREEADRRVRRPGKDEDVFIGTFPDHEMELGVDSPPEWVDEEWKELGEFLLKRGYRVEGEPASSKVLAVRTSDSLPLFLHLVPIDDVSYELDVVEHLSSSGSRSSATSHGVIAAVPTIGIIPLNEDWSAVLTERWEPLTPVTESKFPQFAKDVAGAVSFLHTQHIAHLSLSPATVAYLPTLDRWSLASFESSIQGDPLAKRPTLVTGAASETPKGYSAPELSDDVAYDPFAVDLWCLGKILQGAAAEYSHGSKPLQSVINSLTAADPQQRIRSSVALASLKAVYP